MKKLLLFLLFSLYLCTGFSQTPASSNSVSDPIADALDSLQQLAFFSCNTEKTDSCIALAASNQSSHIPHFEDLVYEARLAQLDAISPFDLVFNPQVKSYINLYANRKRNLVARAISLSSVYFPLFEEKLALYGLPMELKYLAIVESALNPKAVSRSGASGLWQFMYKTGLMYGLEVNSYADMRRDPVKSTVAACRYLSDLYRALGDWQMVLAAYNCGPGTLAKAIRRSGGKSTYWEVRPYLPPETQGYVPAFIAVNYVMNYTKEHNLFPAPLKSDFFLTDTVAVKQWVSFSQIATITGVPLEDLQFLNPAYKASCIPATAGLTTLELPQSAISVFLQKETEIYTLSIKKPLAPIIAKNSSPLPTKTYHKTRKGETVQSIAALYGVKASDLKKWNRIKKQPLKGQRLAIYLPQPKAMPLPPSDEVSPQTDPVADNQKNHTAAPDKQNSGTEVDSATLPSVADSVKTENTAQEVYHTVQKGDTLWKISNMYKLSSVEELRKINKLAPNYKLVPGTRIKVAPASAKG